MPKHENYFVQARVSPYPVVFLDSAFECILEYAEATDSDFEDCIGLLRHRYQVRIQEEKDRRD